MTSVSTELLRAHLADLCTDANDLAEAMDPDRVIAGAKMLAELREYAAWLATVTRDLEVALGKELGREVVGVEGVGLVAGGWYSGSWKFDDQAALISAVADRARDQRQVDRNGEVESEADAVRRVLTETFSVTPRVTALKALGLDPGDYGTRGDGRPTVKITPVSQ